MADQSDSAEPLADAPAPVAATGKARRVPRNNPESDAGKLHRLFRMVNLLAYKNGQTLHHLAEALEVTERTVRRDLKIIEAAGMQIGQKKSGRRYLLEPADTASRITFTAQEASILREGLLAFPDRPAVNALLRKLTSLVKNDEDPIGTIISSQIPGHIHALEEAILAKKRVLLQEYRSPSSGTIRTRNVEPYGFLDQGRILVAVEVATRQSKQWKVARIGAVQVTDIPASMDAFYEDINEDAFGNQVRKAEQMHVKLRMGMRATELIREEFPRSISFLQEATDEDRASGVTTFSGVIYQPEPLGRFVLGLMNDVEVLGSEAFLQYLRERLQSVTLFNSQPEVPLPTLPAAARAK